MRTGRPRKDNALKKLIGSKHVEAEPFLAPLENPTIPPSSLEPEAQRYWTLFIPSLAKHHKVFEVNRLLLCVLCDALAQYFQKDQMPDGKGAMIGVRKESKELRLFAETITDICREFGITPLSQNKTVQVNGTSQTPTVDSRVRR